MPAFNLKNFYYLHKTRLVMAGLYTVLLCIYLILFRHELLASLSYPNWLIAPIMALGSFVAGSTFLGGGAVAFPALTKLLHIDPTTAKTFSLLIQSVGMSSASIYIMSRVRALPYSFIALYVLGSTLGLIIALSTLQYRIPAVDLRISFSLFLLCFLLLYLFTKNSTNHSIETHLERNIRDIGLTIGCGTAGGCVSGLLGSGADLIGFSLLAMYFRIEIKRATQISVILMASTAVVGSLLQANVYNGISQQSWNLWYIAAPIVLFGAPLGAVFCRRISAQFLLFFICSIVAVEVISTLILVPIDIERGRYYGLAVILSIALLLFFQHQAKIKHA